MRTTINPATVKSLRERKGWTQEQLVRRLGNRLTKRHLQRIESQAGKLTEVAVNANTLEELAHAFRVKSGVLRTPLDQERPRIDDKRVQKPIDLPVSAWVKLELVQAAYALDVETIIELAPLMFVFHAESSLRERRERLAERRRFLALFDLAAKHDDALPDSFERLMGRYLDEEEASIRRRDVVGRFLDPDGVSDGLPEMDPFTEYWQRLSKGFSDPDNLEVDPSPPSLGSDATRWKPPGFSVCTDWLRELTGADPQLVEAIHSRRIVIDEIPEPGWSGGGCSQDWIREKLERLESVSDDSADGP